MTNKKTRAEFKIPLSFFLRRGDRIRTCDHLVPNQVRYRTALRPDCRKLSSSFDKCKGSYKKLFMQYFHRISHTKFCGLFPIDDLRFSIDMSISLFLACVDCHAIWGVT